MEEYYDNTNPRLRLLHVLTLVGKKIITSWNEHESYSYENLLTQYRQVSVSIIAR